MKKVKGIVLERTEKGIIVLTREGEYRRLPAHSRSYPLGTEVEINASPQQAKIPAFAAAAAVLLIIAFTLLWQFAAARPAAYLALDINPSLLLALDKEATIIEAELLNTEDELLIAALELKGLHVVTALELILQEARLKGYLAADRENVVFLSLAAPPGYSLSEDLLKQTVSQRLMKLEVDTYLKISSVAIPMAQEAKQKKISLNALILAEELAARGLFPAEKNASLPETETKVTVRRLLEEVLPEKVFTEKEFIPGKRAKEERSIPGPPESPGEMLKMPQDLSRPPAFSPPGIEKKPEAPGRPAENVENKAENREKERQPAHHRPRSNYPVNNAPDNGFPEENTPGRQKNEK